MCMTSHPTTVPNDLEVAAMNTTTNTSPLPYLTADVLRHAHEWLTTVPGAVAVSYDARALGGQVDEVTVTLRDLHFIHSLDATRFGSHDECPICKADRD